MRQIARPGTILAGLLVSVVVPRLAVFPVHDFGPDEVAYALIGRGVLHGQWPYTVAFDHKPAALYLPYAASEAIFGESITALRALTLGTGVLGFLLVYLVSRRMRLDATLSVLLASLYSVMTLGSDGLGALSEHLLNVYVLAMLWLLLARRGVLVGLLFGGVMGLALHTNYSSGPILAAVGVFYLWRERRHWARWFAAAAGLAVVTVAVLAPIVLWSDIEEYFRLQRQFLGGYETSPTPEVVVAQRFQRFLAPTLQVSLVSVVIAALVRETRNVAVAKWAVLLLVALLTASANGFFWGHYALLLAAPTVLLLGSQLRALPDHRRAVAWVAVAVGVWSLAVPVLPAISNGASAVVRQRSLGPDRLSATYQVAEAVRQISRPGDLMYTRDLHFYYLDDTTIPTRFFFPSHHTNPLFTQIRGTTPDDEMRAIVARRPTVVVLNQISRVPAQQDKVLQSYLKQECSRRVLDQAAIYDCR